MGNSVQEVGLKAAYPEVAEERMAWLGLVLTPGLRPRRILRVIEKAGSAWRLLDMPLTELEALNLPAAAAQFVYSDMARKAADEQLKRMVQTGAGFLTHGDDEYPTRLQEIYDAPPVLWLRGEAAEPALDCGSGGAASYAVWDGHGGDGGAEFVGQWHDDIERDGAGSGYGSAQGRAGGEDTDRGGVGTGVDVISRKKINRWRSKLLRRVG